MLAALCRRETGTGCGSGEARDRFKMQFYKALRWAGVVLFRSCLKSGFLLCSFLVLICDLCFWKRKIKVRFLKNRDAVGGG